MNTRKSSPPVRYSAVVSTVNADRSPLLSEVVSAVIDGLQLTVSLPRHSATAKNLVRTGECVINLPDAETTTAIKRLIQAVTSIAGNVDADFPRTITGGNFAPAHMTLLPSETVAAWRALECPIQIEAKVENAARSVSKPTRCAPIRRRPPPQRRTRFCPTRSSTARWARCLSRAA